MSPRKEQRNNNSMDRLVPMLSDFQATTTKETHVSLRVLYSLFLPSGQRVLSLCYLFRILVCVPFLLSSAEASG